MNEFWRDSTMDEIINTIIDIFTNTPEVELVRLKGLTKFLNKTKSISEKEVILIISKLNFANVIDFEYELQCPHCGETSYVIIPQQGNLKMCDTCNTFYQLELNKTLFNNITRK